MLSPSTRTLAGNRPWAVSYLSRCALVCASPRSLTATNCKLVLLAALVVGAQNHAPDAAESVDGYLDHLNDAPDGLDDVLRTESEVTEEIAGRRGFAEAIDADDSALSARRTCARDRVPPASIATHGRSGSTSDLTVTCDPDGRRRSSRAWKRLCTGISGCSQAAACAWTREARLRSPWQSGLPAVAVQGLPPARSRRDVMSSYRLPFLGDGKGRLSAARNQAVGPSAPIAAAQATAVSTSSQGRQMSMLGVCRSLPSARQAGGWDHLHPVRSNRG